MPENSQKFLYKRVLLKLSGESLAGKNKTGIDPDIMDHFVEEVKKPVLEGLQLGIVIGGGNIFRGLSRNAARMDRVTADHMGMLATVINSLALKDAFINAGIPAIVMSAINIQEFAEPFSKTHAIEHLKKGRIVIFGAGTGNPYFTTDTAAVLRAIEIEADAVLKGTRVDGVYSADPEKDNTAKKFDKLSYMEVVKLGLKVMDTTAITLSMDNGLPIVVFDFNTKNNLFRLIKGEKIGTKVQR